MSDVDDDPFGDAREDVAEMDAFIEEKIRAQLGKKVGELKEIIQAMCKEVEVLKTHTNNQHGHLGDVVTKDSLHVYGPLFINGCQVASLDDLIRRAVASGGREGGSGPDGEGLATPGAGRAVVGPGGVIRRVSQGVRHDQQPQHDNNAMDSVVGHGEDENADSRDTDRFRNFNSLANAAVREVDRIRDGRDENTRNIRDREKRPLVNSTAQRTGRDGHLDELRIQQNSNREDPRAHVRISGLPNAHGTQTHDASMQPAASQCTDPSNNKMNKKNKKNNSNDEEQGNEAGTSIPPGGAGFAYRSTNDDPEAKAEQLRLEAEAQAARELASDTRIRLTRKGSQFIPQTSIATSVATAPTPAPTTPAAPTPAAPGLTGRARNDAATGSYTRDALGPPPITTSGNPPARRETTRQRSSEAADGEEGGPLQKRQKIGSGQDKAKRDQGKKEHKEKGGGPF